MKEIDEENLKMSKKLDFISFKELKIKSNNLRDYFKFLDEDIILKEGDLVVDMGANIGDVSSIFCGLGAKVHSFEPTKTTFEVLKRRLKTYPNIVFYNTACWNKNEKLKFYHHEWVKYNPVHWSNGNSLLSQKNNINKDDYEEVDAIDVSEFIFSLKNEIYLLKIDVEGAEIEIINSLIDTSAIDKIKKIICEVHDKKYSFLREPTRELKKKIEKMGLNGKINLEWH